MNLKTMLAALQGITAYKDLLTQPVMERALRLVACAAHGDGLGGLEAYTDLFYQLRVEGYPGLGQWLGDALRWSEGPYPRLAEGEGRDPALVETYGELPGEDQYSEESELALVGQMVDESRVVVETGRVRMNLFLAF